MILLVLFGCFTIGIILSISLIAILGYAIAFSVFNANSVTAFSTLIIAITAIITAYYYLIHDRERRSVFILKEGKETLQEILKLLIHEDGRSPTSDEWGTAGMSAKLILDWLQEIPVESYKNRLQAHIESVRAQIQVKRLFEQSPLFYCGLNNEELVLPDEPQYRSTQDYERILLEKIYEVLNSRILLFTNFVEEEALYYIVKLLWFDIERYNPNNTPLFTKDQLSVMQTGSKRNNIPQNGIVGYICALRYHPDIRDLRRGDIHLRSCEELRVLSRDRAECFQQKYSQEYVYQDAIELWDLLCKEDLFNNLGKSISLDSIQQKIDIDIDIENFKEILTVVEKLARTYNRKIIYDENTIHMTLNT